MKLKTLIDLNKEDSLAETKKEMIRSGKAMIVGRDLRTGELIIDDHHDDFWALMTQFILNE